MCWFKQSLVVLSYFIPTVMACKFHNICRSFIICFTSPMSLMRKRMRVLKTLNCSIAVLITIMVVFVSSWLCFSIVIEYDAIMFSLWSVSESRKCGLGTLIVGMNWWSPFWTSATMVIGEVFYDLAFCFGKFVQWFVFGCSQILVVLWSFKPYFRVFSLNGQIGRLLGFKLALFNDISCIVL